MTKFSPAFQFYPADFLSDENVVLMTNSEVGCYIKLLCYCWRQGSIPDDISKLAKLCNETDNVMAELWTAIKPCFKNGIVEGRLIHQRLKKELEKQQKFSQERSESGKKGAEIRWKKKNNSSAIAKPMAKPMAKNSSSSSSSINKYSVDFLKFYDLYPLKKEKKEAFKKWEKLKKQNQLPSIEIIISAVQNQIDWRKNSCGDFRPEWKHPAVWLNKGCWDDECDVSKRKKILTGDEALYYDGA